jgi:hypothetical protein
VQLPPLPAASVTEQVTGVFPIGKLVPLGGVHAGVNVPLTESLAVAANATTAPDELVEETV